MVDKNDKSELLSQLTIDKSARVEQEKNWPLPLTLGAVVGLLLGLGISYASGGLGSKPEEISTKVDTSSSKDIKNNHSPTKLQQEPEPKLSVSEKVLNASGYITARRLATVSSQIMGLIKSVDVEEGMKVEAGQVLASLDASIAEVDFSLAKAQVEVQEARLMRLNSELSEAERVLKRVSKLKGESYSSEAQLTKAQTELDAMGADLASAKADLRVAEFNARRLEETLNRHTIRAPFSGVVTVKNAQPGEIVAPAAAGGGFTRTGICTIVDMDSLEIEVDVNEAYINRVYPGQDVLANLDAYPDWDIPASVIAVIPTAIRAKATVQVRIKLQVVDSRILPDMGVKVAFLK